MSIDLDHARSFVRHGTRPARTALRRDDERGDIVNSTLLAGLRAQIAQKLLAQSGDFVSGLDI